MTNRILPDQIAENWEFLKEGFRKSLPPLIGNQDLALTNIFNNLIMDRMQLFVTYKEDGRPMAAVVTMIKIDPGTYSKNLLIYCFAKFGLLNHDLLQDGWEVLRRFGEVNNCFYINAFSKEHNVLSIVEKLGGDTSWTYISMRI